jgi:Cu/Ag efflux pump CusA
MAIVVIFGLLLSTFLTLVVVPVLYSLIHSVQERFRKMTGHPPKNPKQPA